MTGPQTPLSPFLQYRPQLTSVLSITHRITGVLLCAGAVLLSLWLVAIAAGAETYAAISGHIAAWYGRFVIFGFVFSLYYHLCNGIRHLLGRKRFMTRRLLSGKKEKAEETVRRWWYQRLSAVALLPLTLWFIYDMSTLASLEYAAVREWLAAPSTIILFILLIPALFYHAQIGIEEVIEDYIAHESQKTAATTLTRFLAAVCALASIAAVMTVTIGM